MLLAGDAAHVHSPAGGQGLNLGVQDAVNLGWKLTHVVRGTSPESLLDTYQAERHPIAARLLLTTMAATVLNRGDERTKVLREAMSELLRMDEPRKRYAGMMSGLDIRYDLGTGHPLLGRRMPDLDLVTESGPRRIVTGLGNHAFAIFADLGDLGARFLCGSASGPLALRSTRPPARGMRAHGLPPRRCPCAPNRDRSLWRAHGPALR